MTDIEKVKERLDLVSLISEYVQLKTAGVNHKGLCPFHKEKSPSFMVSRERQTWHCFGCGKGGDAFTFLEEIEGVSFPEALKLLADKVGVKLERLVGGGHGSAESADAKSRLSAALALAVRFYEHILWNHPLGAEGLAYLRRRGLKDETIRAWRLGFSPDRWNALSDFLQKKKFTIKEMSDAGLVIVKEDSRGYDRFRGRVMYPIFDHHNSITGFTGRVLKETETSGGKYVNTPKTVLYDKSRLLYGLNEAKSVIREAGEVVLVEGQMDVLACHEFGMKNAVAASGTALTEEQLALLKRYTSNLSMAFDGDSAGVAAARRGIGLALQLGLRVKVIAIPTGGGKDPDECLRLNKDVWFDSVKNAKPYLAWLMDLAFVDKNLRDPSDKQAIAEFVLPDIMLLPYAVEREDWLMELSRRLGASHNALRTEGERLMRQIYRQKKFPGEIKPDSQIVKNQKTESLSDEEADFLCLLFAFPDFLLPLKNWFFLTAIDVEAIELASLFVSWYSSIRDKSFVDTIPSESLTRLYSWLTLRLGHRFSDMDQVAAKNQAELILSKMIRLKKSDLSRELALAEANGEKDKIEKLWQEIQKFSEFRGQ